MIHDRPWKIHAVRRTHTSSAARHGTAVWWDTLCGRTMHSPFTVEGGVVDLGPATCRTCKRVREREKSMRSKSEIESQIARIEADPRYNYPPADPFVNGPLALIQVELKGQVAALRWAAGLDKELATSAKPAKTAAKKSVKA